MRKDAGIPAVWFEGVTPEGDGRVTDLLRNPETGSVSVHDLAAYRARDVDRAPERVDALARARRRDDQRSAGTRAQRAASAPRRARSAAPACRTSSAPPAPARRARPARRRAATRPRTSRGAGPGAGPRRAGARGRPDTTRPALPAGALRLRDPREAVARADRPAAARAPAGRRGTSAAGASCPGWCWCAPASRRSDQAVQQARLADVRAPEQRDLGERRARKTLGLGRGGEQLRRQHLHRSVGSTRARRASASSIAASDAA